MEASHIIPIAKPIIGPEEKLAVWQVLESAQLAQGERVAELEREFAAFIGVKYAVAVSSGTAALHVALLAHGIGPGDEVITSPFSFIATANAILMAGARVVFADIDPATYNLDPEQVAARITSRTRALLPVHLFGQACDLDAIGQLARQHHLAIVEDACQAHGALFSGRKVGSFGTGCFSFYATKNMTTGEGGIITTDDGAIAESARLIRSHGAHGPYRHEILGYNYRMTDIQAALGLVQLKKLEEWNAARIENALYLSQHLQGVIPPFVARGRRHVFHQYTVRIPNDRDLARAKFQAAGVGTAVHYPLPIHWQPLYRKLGYRDQLPEAERASQEVLSLPVHPGLSMRDLEQIVKVTAALG